LTKIDSDTVAGLVSPLSEKEPVEFAGFTSRVKVLATPPSAPVRVTVCAVFTAEAVALIAAVLAPAAMFTVAGTVTAELLLDKVTEVVDCAVAVRETVQVVVAGPVNEAAPQET
jgi:hypothetical protein